MNLAQRGLAHREHQSAPLLEDDVRGAMNEVVADAVRDGSERAHAARCDDHPHRDKRAAGDGRSNIADGVAFVCEVLHLLNEDRKSTRLNSSHLVISYAVFCLKKKNHTTGWRCHSQTC